MDGSMRGLSCYRIEHAKEMLIASEENLKVKQYKTSLNRSYYAIFHAMRAANILEGFDSSKHSGVIAYFNRSFLKNEKIDRTFSVIIKEASFLREKSDYDDFYIASKGEAVVQLENAKIFVDAVERYINGQKI